MISECSLSLSFPRQIFACFYVDLLLLLRVYSAPGVRKRLRRPSRATDEMKWEVNDVESRRRLLLLFPFFPLFRLYNLQQRQQRGKSNPFGDFGSSSPSAPVEHPAAAAATTYIIPHLSRHTDR